MKLLTCLPIIAIVLLSADIHAQWTNTGGPPSRYIKCFTVTGSVVLAGTDGGLVSSTNNGASWVNAGGGIPFVDIRALLPVASYPFDVVAGTSNGRTSMSTNFGANWADFPDNSVQISGLAHINSIVMRGSQFWVGTERGVYLLPQYYPLSTWIQINTGLASGEFTAVRTLHEKNGDIFAGTPSGVYKLNGFTWVLKSNGLTNTNVSAFGSTGEYLVAGTSQGSVGGVYISTDNGENWTLSKSDAWVTSILTIGSTIFVGSFGDGVWRSTNFGTSWAQINDGFGGAAYYVSSLGADNQYVFAGTNNANVWRRSLSQVTDVKDQAQIQPDAFTLEQNYPNPFNPSTTIRYTLPERSLVTLKICNILGQEVATLVNGMENPGAKQTRFNANNMASGVYFYRLTTTAVGTDAHSTTVKKMMLIR